MEFQCLSTPTESKEVTALLAQHNEKDGLVFCVVYELDKETMRTRVYETARLFSE